MTVTTEKKPLRIGLTGGIASGKSTIADMFAALGVPIVDTDVIAREIVAPGAAALVEIRARFGDEIIDATGNLDRGAMRKLVFADDSARSDLEAILHPRIGVETRRQADAAGGPYQIIVVPLLAGSALLQFVDRVLLVDCDEETQIERLLARDAETDAQARSILAAQASRDQLLELADDVVGNNGDIDDARRQVASLDSTYRLICESPRGSAE